jgi:hypothetical protein
MNFSAHLPSRGDQGRAADSFARAARAPWGRIPRPTQTGGLLRTASYLLAACHPGGYRGRTARLAMLTALAGLARALADLRRRQQERFQTPSVLATSADLAAAGLTAAAARVPDEPADTVTRVAARPRAAQRPGNRPARPVQRRGPGR